ncbi:MAG TPA: antibiotic biosynthesis monooxygenase family protein [Solimonas sp.]|nr:antibiotic biosynthesis monooxygenase family protein [Solimonas sp.]
MSADALPTGFAVIYQWRIRAGKEAQFQQAWEKLTGLLRTERGARGSRLHRTDYGSWVAYAQWPDRATWERSCALHKLDEALSKQMLDAVEETWAPMLMTLISDRLVAEPLPAEPHALTH